MITYKQGVKDGAPIYKVFVDGKEAGVIVIYAPEGYQYLPQGRADLAGEVFMDLQELCESLEYPK